MPTINLSGLPNRTNLIFFLIVVLCVGVFIPAIEWFYPAIFFLILIPIIALYLFLRHYEQERRRWQATPLESTHPHLAHHIRTLAGTMGLSSRCLELWCTTKSTAAIHMIGTFRRHALIIYNELADDFETVCTRPDRDEPASPLLHAHVDRVLIQEFEHLTSFWNRYIQALLNTRLHYEREARHQWKPQNLDETHPQLAQKLRNLARGKGISSGLQLWCVDQHTVEPARVPCSFRTTNQIVFVLTRRDADEFEPALERNGDIPPLSKQEADAVLCHELAHLHHHDVTLVMAARALTLALGVYALSYLVDNTANGWFLLNIPSVLNTVILNAQKNTPELVEQFDIGMSEKAYRLTWVVEGNNYSGVGILQGDILSVGWGATDECKTMIYEIQPDGTMDGLWGSRVTATEYARPASHWSPGSIVGTYTITGTYSDGEPYDGTIEITPYGAVYHIHWDMGVTQRDGVGILQDNMLSIGWGTEQETCSVTSFRVRTDGTMDGIWGQYNHKQVGTIRARLTP